nr:hypothetical protein GCM10020093_019180 [Planobispora longispora]
MTHGAVPHAVPPPNRDPARSDPPDVRGHAFRVRRRRADGLQPLVTKVPRLGDVFLRPSGAPLPKMESPPKFAGGSVMSITLETGRVAEEGAWRGFRGGVWCSAIDVRDFVHTNYTPTPGTRASWPGPPSARWPSGTA